MGTKLAIAISVAVSSKVGTAAPLVAPANTVAPVVSVVGGLNPIVGRTLQTTTGSWTGNPAPTFTYQWQNAGVDISLATNSTYVIQAGDVGDAIRCVVTGTNSQGAASANSNAITVSANTVPVNTVAPVVSVVGGLNPIVGRTLQTTDGTWTGTPTPTFTYQWQNNTVNISGETASTYVIQAGDVADSIRCVVTGTNVEGIVSANSNGITISANTVPVNTVAPAVNVNGGGSPIVGAVLSTTDGTWTGTPTPTFTYQWQNNGVDIGSQTAASYTLVSGDVADTIRCVVTGTNTEGAVAANSNGIVVSGNSVPVNTVAPVASVQGGGNPLVGRTLQTTDGTWTGTPTPTFTYQWQNEGVDISGQTASTYVIVTGDIADSIRCVVTGTNTEGAASANSNGITVSGNSVPVNTVAPVAFVQGAAAISAVGTPTTAKAADGANVTITLPSTLQGDYVVLHVGTPKNAGAAMVSSGWTQLASNDFSTLARDAWFGKFMGSTPDTSAQVTGTGAAADACVVTARAYRNVDPTTPMDATPTSNGANSTNPNPSAITTVTNGAVVLIGFSSRVNDPTIGAPSGYSTPVGDAQTDTNPSTVWDSDKTVATAGAEDPGAFTSVSTSNHVVTTLALRPGQPSPIVGAVLEVTDGTWTGVPTPTFTYQWQNNTVDISGETADTYTIVSGDVGDSIRCVVTATNAEGVVSANSNAITPV